MLALSTALQQSSPAPTLVEGAGSEWWHALAAGAWTSHHMLHSRGAFCPAASVMTIQSTAVRNTGCSLCQDSKNEATTRARRSRRKEGLLSTSLRLRTSAYGISARGADYPAPALAPTATAYPNDNADDSGSTRRGLFNSERLDGAVTFRLESGLDLFNRLRRERPLAPVPLCTAVAGCARVGSLTDLYTLRGSRLLHDAGRAVPETSLPVIDEAGCCCGIVSVRHLEKSQDGRP